MRAAPAFHVVLTRFGLWQAGVAVVTVATVACIVAWVATQGEAPSAGMVVAAAVGAAVTVLVGASLWRSPSVGLGWDGERWHLDPPTAAGGDVCTGSVTVAVDLGGWLLLRFVPDRPSLRVPATWLPVQRRGLESQWHGLRCALYSPGPSPGHDALADQ